MDYIMNKFKTNENNKNNKNDKKEFVIVEHEKNVRKTKELSIKQREQLEGYFHNKNSK